MIKLYEKYDKDCYTYQDYSETFFNYLKREPIYETILTIILSWIFISILKDANGNVYINYSKILNQEIYRKVWYN